MEDTITRTRRSGSSTSGEGENVTRSSRNNYNAQEIRNNSSSQDDDQQEYENTSSQNKTVKYRIGSAAAISLIFVAGFLDITELALDLGGTFLAGVGVVFGYLKDFATIVLIPGMFTLLGAPFWKGKKAKKKMATMVTSFLISLIPWIGGIMPETVISVVVTIYLTRQEDRGKVQRESFKNIAKITRRKRG